MPTRRVPDRPGLTTRAGLSDRSCATYPLPSLLCRRNRLENLSADASTSARLGGLRSARGIWWEMSSPRVIQRGPANPRARAAARPAIAERLCRCEITKPPSALQTPSLARRIDSMWPPARGRAREANSASRIDKRPSGSSGQRPVILSPFSVNHMTARCSAAAVDLPRRHQLRHFARQDDRRSIRTSSRLRWPRLFSSRHSNSGCSAKETNAVARRR